MGSFEKNSSLTILLSSLGLHLSSLLVKCVEDVACKSSHSNFYKKNERFNFVHDLHVTSTLCCHYIRYDIQCLFKFNVFITIPCSTLIFNSLLSYFLHIITNTKFKHVTSTYTLVDIQCLSLHLTSLTFIRLFIFSICIRI